MTGNYAKIFPTMFSGSMYGAGLHVFATWAWILTHKDEQGLVEVNPRLVAAELGADVEQIERAIEYLTTPDPESRSPDEEGRRMVRVSQFGYRVVNHTKYRTRGQDRTEYWRDYKAKKRAESRAHGDCPHVDNCGQSTNSTHADADADADAKAEEENTPPKPPRGQGGADARFDRFWRAYPRKVGKDAARRAFRSRKPDEPLLRQMLEAIASQAASEQWLKDGGQYIPHPSTWLSEGRWQDEAPPARSGPWVDADGEAHIPIHTPTPEEMRMIDDMFETQRTSHGVTIATE